MADDHSEDASSPGENKARRAPPTIDLTASDVSENREGEGQGDATRRRFRWSPAAVPPPLTAALSGAVCGAVAAILVMMAFGSSGWFSPAPDQNGGDAAAINSLAGRVAAIESRKPTTPDPAITTRLETVAKSLDGARAERADLHARIDQLSAAIREAKPATADAASTDATSRELAALQGRMSEIEASFRTQAAQPGAAASAGAADDVPLRRAVTASLLDVSVRHGDAFETILRIGKSLAPEPAALQPLDRFAASGVPNAAALCRELVTLAPSLLPPAPEPSPSGSGLVDRLQASAVKLVRIERTDGTGSDRRAIVARLSAAALRNDLAEARRQLNLLEPAERGAAQGWLEKADAREQALASSHQFAIEAMAALAGPTH